MWSFYTIQSIYWVSSQYVDNTCKETGINANDKNLYSLQFADDQVVVAYDRKDLEYMTRNLQEEKVGNSN